MSVLSRLEPKPWWPNWSGETVVIAASGKSQNKRDLDYVRGKARVIAVNRTWELCPWADVLYSAGSNFWETYKPDFGGMMVSGDAEWPGAYIERVRDWLPNDHSLSNSGAQAIVYADAWGAARIVLTGMDMRGRHWHEDHRNGNPYSRFGVFRQGLARLANELRAEVVNCSRDTELDCFPRADLEQTI